MAEQVRTRVLRWFSRSGLIEPEDVREMLAAAPVEQILTCPSVSHHTDPRCWDKAGLPASRVIGLTAKPPSGSFRIAWTNPRPLGAVVPTTAMIFLSLIWDYRLSASLPWILDSRHAGSSVDNRSCSRTHSSSSRIACCDSSRQ
jgi:hypothetical protein